MLKILNIKIENKIDGCITDNPNPRITFSLDSDKQNVSLKKAVIRIGDWIHETTEQISIIYDGTPLTPHTIYIVEINAEDNHGQTAKSKVQFSTSKLNEKWAAKWITDLSYIPVDKVSAPPMKFKKSFTAGGKIERAYINATALGIYELELNGTKVGDQYFAPGLTSYNNQQQYQTYDITDMLKCNNDVIAVVGAGWAAGRFTYAKGGKTQISADRQALLMELVIVYTDGKAEKILTDESWLVTTKSKFVFGDWYDGEIYDATIDETAASWKNADLTAPRVMPKLIAEYGEPVKKHETLKPIGYTKAPSGEYIYDFGQNFAGVISAKINGNAGQKIIFRHAEVLYENELFVKSLRTAKATAEYTCISGAQDYSPRLTYMGFRYVGVRGIDPKDIELSAFALYSDIAETGSFECSNPLLNQLQSNIVWGGKSNFVDIPTDCPQRDERQGWTGDIAVFAQTACYNFDMSRFFDKWLLDVKAEQGKGGGIPMVVPQHGDNWPVVANSCWGDSCVLVPWAEYLARGDKELLRSSYPVIKKFLKAAKWWAGFLSVRKSRRHIWKWLFHFGDWCAPDGSFMQWIRKGKWVGTAYWANSCQIASEIAAILGEASDSAYYAKLRLDICSAYSKVFTDRHGKLKKEFQTAYVLPLHFNMVQGEEYTAMAKNLDRMVRDAGYHLSTGFTGTPYLLFALADSGYTDTAFKVLLQETCPSWLYEVKAGGTTIWERWDALKEDGTVNTGNGDGGGMVSFNHYANGAVGDFLYKRIAGIEPVSGGYKKFEIAPKPGGGLTNAKAEVKTPYGNIVSKWEIDKGKFILNIKIPVSTECKITLPDSTSKTVVSGNYTFECIM